MAGQKAAGRAPDRRVIYLFRHAKSAWDDASLPDFERPLALRGRRAGKTMSRHMQEARVRPALVLCSPAARTRQTLESVLPALGQEVPVRYEHDLYHAGPGQILELLRGLPDDVTSVMLIGHNPALQALAVGLVGRGDSDARARLGAKFPTAALATLILHAGHWRELTGGACEIQDFVAPRQLA